MGSGQALSTAQDRGLLGPTFLAELKHKLLGGIESKMPTASSSRKEESVLVSCGAPWAASASW